MISSASSSILKSMASPSVFPKGSSYDSDLGEDEDVFNAVSGEDPEDPESAENVELEPATGIPGCIASLRVEEELFGQTADNAIDFRIEDDVDELILETIEYPFKSPTLGTYAIIAIDFESNGDVMLSFGAAVEKADGKICFKGMDSEATLEDAEIFYSLVCLPDKYSGKWNA